MKSQKSMQLALGGVFSAVCLLLMFCSSMVPFSSFALPMMAGAALIAVIIENGAKTAFLVYVSVSLLSIFIVPDLETKLLFISFFGYYPILKPALDRINTRALQYIVKFSIFNASVLAAYFLSIKLFGVEEALAGNETLGRFAVVSMLAGLNFTFLMYDYLLVKLTAFYLFRFKPKFLRR